MLEVKERGIGLTASELESSEENSDANANSVREKEALTEVTDGIGDAGFIGVVARRVETTLAALSTLQLLYGIPEALLRLAKAALRG